MINIEKLKFSYNSTFYLNIDTLAFEKGKLHVIVGENGSGKTTFAKIICGIEKNYKGNVEIDSFNIANLNPKALSRIISYSSKRIIKSGFIKVKDFVETGRYAHQNSIFFIKTKQNNMIVDEALELTDLSHKKDSMLHELSDGELQRVSIAKILAQETKYAVLDEPTSNLDLKHTKLIVELLDKLKHKTTFIVIMHNINEALKIYDTLIGMKNGQIELIWNNRYFDLKKLEKLFTIKLNLFEKNGNRVVYF